MDGNVEKPSDATSTKVETPTPPINGKMAITVLEDSMKALRNTRILSVGGLVAYGIYAVAILVVLFLVLNTFTNVIENFLGQLIIVFGLLLAAGIIGTAMSSYLTYKKLALGAQIEADVFKQKVDLVKQRGTLFIQLLDNWQKNDYRGFSDTMKNGQILLAIDKSYQDLGLSGELFKSTMKDEPPPKSKSLPEDSDNLKKN